MLTASMLSGLAAVVGLAALLCFLATLTEALFWLPPYARVVMVVSVCVAFAAATAVLLLRPALQLSGLLQRPTREDIARKVEKVVPNAKDRLVAFLDLSGGRHTNSPQDIVEEALHSLFEPFRDSSFDSVETFERVRGALKVWSLPLLALALFVAIAPGPFSEASNRLLHPMAAFVKPAPFTISVAPGNADLIHGDSIAIEIKLIGNVTATPTLELRRDREKSEVIAPAPGIDPSTFHHLQANVRRDFEYRAVAGTVSSPWYRVEILNRPVVRELSVTIASPRYSRIGKVRLDPNVGDVTALPGSIIDIAVLSGGGQTEAGAIVFDDGMRVPLEVSGASATGTFRLTRPGSYHIELETVDGVSSDNPIEYRLQVVVDGPPSVAILAPDLVSELVEPFETEISARVADDFGIRKLALMYRRAESRFGVTSETFTEADIKLPSPVESEQVVAHLWKVAEGSQDIVPGDVIEYFLRVWDNDAYAGYKSSDSRVHRLVMPSLADRYREMNESTDDTADQIDDLRDKADDIGDRFRQLRNELQRKPQSDWDDERELEQIREMQRQLEESIENVSSGLDDLAQQMNENNLVSEETLDMFEQLQKVMQEINSPELMEALEKLRESMQSLDLQQMQQSMNDFEFNEEQFKERLERALDLFKRLQIQQGLEEAARRAEELAKLQEELRKATSELADPKDQQLKEEDPNGNRSDESEDVDDTQDEQNSEKESTDAEQNPSSQSEDDEARDKASDPGQRQQEVDRLAAEQERSEAEMRELEKRLEELQQQMNELSKQSGDKLEELREQLEIDSLPEQMKENAEQLRNDEMQPAMEGQQQMQQQLSRLQQQLSQMQQNMRGNQLQLNIAGLRQVLNDILVLSQQQEEMRNEVSATEAESPSLRSFARQQIELGEGLRVVSDTLQKLSREIPEMSREVQVQTGLALREIQIATEALAERSARRASGHQKGSMMHLNELALLLSDLLSQLMNQQMGMGMPSMQQMLEQLQQMSGQQQQLNEQIQQMLNDMQGQRLSSDAQARMRQLAEQQSRIREQLKELSRNPELRGKALGDLDEIARQMEETIRELEQSRVDRALINRQQQILTRLLDASRSVNERGKEKRRESRSGDDVDRESPPELSPEERTDQLRRDLIRALESGYAPDYEELIRRYFKLLQELGDGAVTN